MLTSFLHKSLIPVLVACALMTSACAKEDESAVRVSDRGAGSADPVATPQDTTICGGDAAKQIGRIYNKSGNKYIFKSAVQAFVSAVINPEEIGDISASKSDPTTGVELRAAFDFDDAGNLNAAGSSFTIRIVDSYVGKPDSTGKLIIPYDIGFTAAKSGHYDKNTNWLSVTFEDAYGTIKYEGRLSADKTLVTGTVSFVNTKAYGGGTPAAGVLGDFEAYACSMIR